MALSVITSQGSNVHVSSWENVVLLWYLSSLLRDGERNSVRYLPLGCPFRHRPSSPVAYIKVVSLIPAASQKLLFEAGFLAICRTLSDLVNAWMHGCLIDVSSFIVRTRPPHTHHIHMVWRGDKRGPCDPYKEITLLFCKRGPHKKSFYTYTFTSLRVTNSMDP